MPWTVLFHWEFQADFDALPEAIQDELLACIELLKDTGPTLGRPRVDTLKASSFPNMKELRFQLDGVWRFAFAFDPRRQAIVLVGGDKEGRRQEEFYRELIRVADRRFAAHIAGLRREEEK